MPHSRNAQLGRGQALLTILHLERLVRAVSPPSRATGFRTTCLSDRLLVPCRLSEQVPAVYGLPFPAKTWFGGGNDEATTKTRRAELHEWMKGVVEQCPGNREVMMFLADDGRYV